MTQDRQLPPGGQAKSRSRYSAARLEKIKTVSGCRARILTYLVERRHYYQHVVNLHNLSLETINRVQPTFKAL